jgi:hypothetical protein
LVVAVFTSCRYHHTEVSENWDLTAEQRDSISFANTHHYTLNYNFTVSADSLILQANPPSNLPEEKVKDSLTIYRDEKLVVADILKISTDTTPTTFWIKVARDQETMGWIPEATLLKNVIPCDPISQFIHAFSNKHLFALYILMGIAACFYIYRITLRKRIFIVHFNDIHSFYPTLFCLFTALAATLYGSIQKFVPDTWQEFYFYPTLNPFGQPFILWAFIVNVWLMLLSGIATVDDVLKQLSLSEAVTYLFGLVCTSLVLYIFFSLSIQIYIGYPCLLVYAAFAIRRYLHHDVMPYLCGHCGKPLHHLGRCPYCGTMNK